MPIDLAPSRIKLMAARDHIERIKRAATPLDPAYYEIALKEITDGPMITERRPKIYGLVYTPQQPIPELLANMIGDALGNLKSSLDYAAVRIEPKTYFPTCPRADLPTQRSLQTLDASLPGFRDMMLNTVRPEHGPDEPLWGLVGKANNENKHEDFIPTVTMAQVKNINVRFAGGSVVENLNITGDAAKPINLVGSGAPFQFRKDCEAIAELTFGASTSTPNEPVIPTLESAADAVERTLSAIDKLANP